MEKFKFIAILTILLYCSFIPYHFNHPFQNRPGLEKMVSEIASENDQDIILVETNTNLKQAWFYSLMTVLLGIVSGMLLLKQKKVGWWLALGISIFTIYHQRGFLYRMFSYGEEYTSMLSEKIPLMTLHNMLLILICVYTIFYLLSNYQQLSK